MDEYRYRMYIKGETLQGEEPSIVRRWDLEALLGGSVDYVPYALPGGRTGNYTLHFRNEHEKQCDVQVYFLVTYLTDKDHAVDVDPETNTVLISLHPRTIYVGVPVTLTFQLETPPDPSDLAVYTQHDCSQGMQMAPGKEEDAGELHMQSIGPNRAVWTMTVMDSGTYSLCYQRQGLYYFVGQITVFGGNPGYYVINDGQARRYRIRDFWVVHFYGTNLDRRSGGDSAKIVKYDDECATGDAVGGGMKQSDDLGPDDSFNVPTADYTIKLTKGGRFRMCYRRKGSNWIEVTSQLDLPSREPPTLPPATLPTSTPTPLSTMIPFTPTYHPDTAADLGLGTPSPPATVSRTFIPTIPSTMIPPSSTPHPDTAADLGYGTPSPSTNTVVQSPTVTPTSLYTTLPPRPAPTPHGDTAADLGYGTPSPSCPRAPPLKNPITGAILLNVVVNSYALADWKGMKTDLGTMLCISPNAIHANEVHHGTAAGTYSITMEIACDNITTFCDSRDRMDYLYYLYSANAARLKAMNILQVTEVVAGIVISDPSLPAVSEFEKNLKPQTSPSQHSSGSSHTGVWVSVGLCLTLLAVGGAYIIYRKARQSEGHYEDASKPMEWTYWKKLGASSCDDEYGTELE
jgi:hypothetical protein